MTLRDLAAMAGGGSVVTVSRKGQATFGSEVSTGGSAGTTFRITPDGIRP